MNTIDDIKPSDWIIPFPEEEISAIGQTATVKIIIVDINHWKQQLSVLLSEYEPDTEVAWAISRIEGEDRKACLHIVARCITP